MKKRRHLCLSPSSPRSFQCRVRDSLDIVSALNALGKMEVYCASTRWEVCHTFPVVDEYRRGNPYHAYPPYYIQYTPCPLPFLSGFKFYFFWKWQACSIHLRGALIKPISMYHVSEISSKIQERG